MTHVVSETETLTAARLEAKSQAVSYFSIFYPGEPTFLLEVRRWTAAVVGDKPGVDDVVQVASELAANAILHTASREVGGSFVLHVATFTNRWHVQVDDLGGATEPRVCSASTEDEAGRGLAVVAALANEWGVFGDSYARAVWAEILKPGGVTV